MFVNNTFMDVNPAGGLCNQTKLIPCPARGLSNDVWL